MPNLSADISGLGAATGASLTVTGDVAAATVTAPIFRTTTAADVVFQRNSTEKARLTSTGLSVTGDLSATTVTAPTFGTTTAADVVFQRNSAEIARLSSAGLIVPLGKEIELYNVGAAGDSNYERGYARWSSNVLTIGSEKGGTGTNRAVTLQHGDGTAWKVAGSGICQLDGSASGIASISTFSDTIGIQLFGKVTTSTTVAGVTLANSPSANGFSASSGTQKGVRAASTVNQSGTAAFIGLEADVTPTATGSGTVMGLSVKRSTVQVFGIDVKATLTADADTVMFLTYYSGGAVKHARVTLGADSGGFRNLQVAT